MGVPNWDLWGPTLHTNNNIYIYILINIGLGHLAWDMIWAHVAPWARAPGPGALGPLSPELVASPADYPNSWREKAT